MVCLQAAPSLDSCAARSWYLCLEAVFTLVGLWMVSEMLVGEVRFFSGHPPNTKGWSGRIIVLGLLDNALGLSCSLSLGD